MLGRPLVLLAMAFAGWAGIAAPFGARRPDLMGSARRAMVASCVCLVAAAASLWWSLFTRDFSIAYVAQNVSRAQQGRYVLSAFWAGMDGSMLLWCLLLSVFAAAHVSRRAASAAPFLPWSIPVLSASLLFFCAMTAGPTNPFRTLDVAPADGRGLNPLLQSPGMLIHPPVLYSGYIGTLVPFALVVGALVTGRTGPEWLRAVRRWALVPWLALGIGMVLGGAWAYTELGWGGYWGWDPVENAALLPWLALTAFLHSSLVEERRGMLRVWNVLLLLLAADLAVFGTFLTRSGLLSSVHTFTESPLGRWYFGYLAAQTIGGLALLAWRLPLLRAESHLDGVVSKESGFLVNNLLFAGATVAIFWGTMLPIFTEAFGGDRLAVGPPFFNRLMAPLGTLLLALAAVGPLLPWRRGTVRSVLRRIARPAGIAGATGAGTALASGRADFALVVAVAVLAAGVALGEIVSAARTRSRATGTGTVRSAVRLFAGNPRRYGGYLVHAGVAVMVVGFAGSLFRTQADVVAVPGERFTFAGYRFDYRELVRERAPDKEVRLAVLDVFRGTRRVARLRPQQNVHLNFDQPQSEIAIRTTPREDLYVVLAGTSPDSDRVQLRLYSNPLVQWVWAGAVLGGAGGLVALLAKPRRARPRRARPRRARPRLRRGRPELQAVPAREVPASTS